MKIAICTLAEKHFHHGVCALANSLCRNGFEGNFWIGYKGALPHWTSGNTQDTAVKLNWVRETTPMHFTHYKPWWMLRVLNQLDTECEGLLYLDPDIVLDTRWGFIEQWITYGIALCQDANNVCPADHPHRLKWITWLENHGYTCHHRPEFYYNGGCLGLRREFLSCLETWQAIITGIGEKSGGLENWRSLDRSYAFWSANQDGMNMMAMASPHSLSTLGPDAMAFAPGFAVLPHAVGSTKPWNKAFITEALKGQPPTAADKAYMQYADGPLASMSVNTLSRKRTAMRIASALGRFIRRA